MKKRTVYTKESLREISFPLGGIGTGCIGLAGNGSLTDWEIRVARNEIYARHGRIFSDPDLNAYFRSQSWYTPRNTADEFSQRVVFNDYESKNINLILNEQTNRGLR